MKKKNGYYVLAGCIGWWLRLMDKFRRRCSPDALFYDYARGELICTESGEVLEDHLPIEVIVGVSSDYPTSEALNKLKYTWRKYGVIKGRGRGRKRLPRDVREEIIRLRREGLKLQEIADKVGVGVGTVWKVLKEAGLKPTHTKTRVTPEIEAKARELRRKGYGLQRIANELGIAVSTVWRILRKKKKRKAKTYTA